MATTSHTPSSTRTERVGCWNSVCAPWCEQGQTPSSWPVGAGGPSSGQVSPSWNDVACFFPQSCYFCGCWCEVKETLTLTLFFLCFMLLTPGGMYPQSSNSSASTLCFASELLRPAFNPVPLPFHTPHPKSFRLRRLICIRVVVALSAFNVENPPRTYHWPTFTTAALVLQSFNLLAVCSCPFHFLRCSFNSKCFFVCLFFCRWTCEDLEEALVYSHR